VDIEEIGVVAAGSNGGWWVAMRQDRSGRGGGKGRWKSIE
jgi:hypothetical protein